MWLGSIWLNIKKITGSELRDLKNSKFYERLYFARFLFSKIEEKGFRKTWGKTMDFFGADSGGIASRVWRSVCSVDRDITEVFERRRKKVGSMDRSIERSVKEREKAPWFLPRRKLLPRVIYYVNWRPRQTQIYAKSRDVISVVHGGGSARCSGSVRTSGRLAAYFLARFYTPRRADSSRCSSSFAALHASLWY